MEIGFGFLVECPMSPSFTQFISSLNTLLFRRSFHP